HVDLLADELEEPRAILLAQGAERRRALEGVAHALDGGLARAPTDEQRDAADLGDAIEQEGHPDLAEEAGEARDEQVSPREGLSDLAHRASTPLASTTGQSRSRAMRRSSRSGVTAQGSATAPRSTA